MEFQHPTLPRGTTCNFTKFHNRDSSISPCEQIIVEGTQKPSFQVKRTFAFTAKISKRHKENANKETPNLSKRGKLSMTQHSKFFYSESPLLNLLSRHKQESSSQLNQRNLVSSPSPAPDIKVFGLSVKKRVLSQEPASKPEYKTFISRRRMPLGRPTNQKVGKVGDRRGSQVEIGELDSALQTVRVFKKESNQDLQNDFLNEGFSLEAESVSPKSRNRGQRRQTVYRSIVVDKKKRSTFLNTTLSFKTTKIQKSQRTNRKFHRKRTYGPRNCTLGSFRSQYSQSLHPKQDAPAPVLNNSYLHNKLTLTQVQNQAEKNNQMLETLAKFKNTLKKKLQPNKTKLSPKFTSPKREKQTLNTLADLLKVFKYNDHKFKENYGNVFKNLILRNS